jgi:hypothetical protein
VPVPYFLLFLCFRKVTQEIFSELDETKAKHPKIHRSFREPKRRWSGATRGPHNRAARPRARLHPLCVWPPRSTSDDAPSPTKTLRPEKPKDPITFPEYIAIRRCHRPEIGRVQKLFPAPCRRGESPPEVFFIAVLASGAMSE